MYDNILNSEHELKKELTYSIAYAKKYSTDYHFIKHILDNIRNTFFVREFEFLCI